MSFPSWKKLNSALVWVLGSQTVKRWSSKEDVVRSAGIDNYISNIHDSIISITSTELSVDIDVSSGCPFPEKPIN